MKRARWLELSEKKLNEVQLNTLLAEWQHRLGMCAWAFKVIKCKDYHGAYYNPISEHYGEIHACDERTLLHELFEARFHRLVHYSKALFPTEKKDVADYYGKCEVWDTEKHIFIFGMVNTLLKLKYRCME